MQGQQHGAARFGLGLNQPLKDAAQGLGIVGVVVAVDGANGKFAGGQRVGKICRGASSAALLGSGNHGLIDSTACTPAPEKEGVQAVQ